MKRKILLLFVFISAFVFSACTKEGPPGPAGEDGNAEVHTVLLNANSFAWDGTYYWRYATWSNVSILTADVNASGAVMLYETNGSGGWFAVPYSFNLGNDVSAHTFFQHATGQVRVYVALSDDSDPGSYSSTFKLVCIPSSARKAHPDLNLTDYEEVKKTFHLKD